jgi:phosphatidylglycerophosphate synthase
VPDVGTSEPPRFRDVVARLSGAQKSNVGAPGYSRWVNRRLGRYLAGFAYLRGLTPNQVTAISSVITFASIALIAAVRPSWPVSTLAVVGLLVGYAFDSADGQLARLRGGGSPAGEWLDHVSDAVKVSAIHLAVAVAWFRFYDLRHAAVLLIPLGYALVSAVFFFSVTLTDQLRRIYLDRNATAAARGGEAAPVLRSLLVLPADYGLLCLSFLLLPWHAGFIAVYSALFTVNTLLLLGAWRNWFTELSALKQR